MDFEKEAGELLSVFGVGASRLRHEFKPTLVDALRRAYEAGRVDGAVAAYNRAVEICQERRADYGHDIKDDFLELVYDVENYPRTLSASREDGK